MSNVMGKLRNGLSKLGYFLWRRYSMRFGIDPLFDIVRLNRAKGLPIKTVFDVGANVGQFHREVIEMIPDSIVHSFEPHPTTYSNLVGVVCAPSRCYQIALGDYCGMSPFYVYGNSLVNSLTPDAGYARIVNEQPRVIYVEITTLDFFCEKEGIEKIDLLKIDAEGFDLAVLKGGERMFRENRISFVYVEFNNLLEDFGSVGGDLLPIAEYLAPFGLHYVTTYTDYVIMDTPLWVVSNALFAYVPSVQSGVKSSK